MKPVMVGTASYIDHDFRTSKMIDVPPAVMILLNHEQEAYCSSPDVKRSG
jgi:hypothetical protein